MNKKLLRIFVISVFVVLLIFVLRTILLKYTAGKKTAYKREQPLAAAVGEESEALRSANRLLTQGKRAEAIKSFEEIINQAGGSRDAYKAVLTLAGIYQQDKNLIKAKELYLKIINEYPQFCDYANIQEKIAAVNMDILFSNIITPDSESYTVAPGDSLAKIASGYSTTVELIKRANNLRSDLIMPGMRLKVQNRPFHIIVDNTQCILTVLLGDEVIKTYDVATGKNNSTPIGEFTVKDKLTDPVWYNKGIAIPPESPENVLGTRWLGLTTPESGYGIHGTTEPESIGYQSTEGCVRMRNDDVEELYSIISVGTSVTIIN
jgi:lipoprotein-anchoring transpeptidase ErfK/SrfK